MLTPSESRLIDAERRITQLEKSRAQLLDLVRKLLQIANRLGAR